MNENRREGNRRRQAALRDRMKAAGLVSVTALVPEAARPDVIALCRRLAGDGDLEISAVPLRRISNGRLVRL